LQRKERDTLDDVETEEWNRKNKMCDGTDTTQLPTTLKYSIEHPPFSQENLENVDRDDDDIIIHRIKKEPISDFNTKNTWENEPVNVIVITDDTDTIVPAHSPVVDNMMDMANTNMDIETLREEPTQHIEICPTEPDPEPEILSKNTSRTELEGLAEIQCHNDINSDIFMQDKDSGGINLAKKEQQSSVTTPNKLSLSILQAMKNKCPLPVKKRIIYDINSDIDTNINTGIGHSPNVKTKATKGKRKPKGRTPSRTIGTRSTKRGKFSTSAICGGKTFPPSNMDNIFDQAVMSQVRH